MKKRLKSDRKYEEWMWVKDGLQARGMKRSFKEWQIWWCSVGENVGIEINGKGKNFVRPVVVYKKFNRFGFIGIPLTSRNHMDSAPDWYVHFKFDGRDEYAALHQIETISVFRLWRQMGTLDDEDIAKIKEGFSRLYFPEKIRPRLLWGRVGKSQTYLYYKRFWRKMQGFCSRLFGNQVKK